MYDYLENYEDIQHGADWSEEIKMTTVATGLAQAGQVGIFIAIIGAGREIFNSLFDRKL